MPVRSFQKVLWFYSPFRIVSNIVLIKWNGIFDILTFLSKHKWVLLFCRKGMSLKVSLFFDNIVLFHVARLYSWQYPGKIPLLCYCEDLEVWFFIRIAWNLKYWGKYPLESSFTFIFLKGIIKVNKESL